MTKAVLELTLRLSGLENPPNDHSALGSWTRQRKTRLSASQAASAAKKTYWLSNDGRRRHIHWSRSSSRAERSDNTHQRIPGAGSFPLLAPAGKRRWRRRLRRLPGAYSATTYHDRTRTETWSLDFNGGLVAKGAKFQWKIQLDHFAAPFVTHCQVRKSEAQVGP